MASEKVVGWLMSSDIGDHRPHDPAYLQVLLVLQLPVYPTDWLASPRKYGQTYWLLHRL